MSERLFLTLTLLGDGSRPISAAGRCRRIDDTLTHFSRIKLCVLLNLPIFVLQKADGQQSIRV